jgi:SAM-dependent methyltransferase
MRTEPDATAEAAEEPDWAAYYRYTLGREPRPLFVKGLAALEAGWRVTAIDSAPAAAEVLAPRVPEAARDRLAIVTAPADEADLPPFDLLYSAYVLTYLEPDAFARLWATARDRLAPGGFVVVNIFGDHHEWASEPGTTYLPREEVERLLEGLEVLVLDELEEDGPSFKGPTHWHVFDIVARRPA